MHVEIGPIILLCMEEGLCDDYRICGFLLVMIQGHLVRKNEK